ncbi:MAG TPA: hypothetical protein DGK91_08185 [Clostridium sp.]|nr:hypothetical protein [Clostridium sp.]
MYIESPKGVNEDSIINLAAKINKEENKELLEKLNDGRWWNPVYWVNYGKNKKREEANSEEFNKRGEAIKGELISVAKEIYAFTNKMSFLMKALKDE